MDGFGKEAKVVIKFLSQEKDYETEAEKHRSA